MAGMFNHEFPPRHARPKVVATAGSFADRFFEASGMPPTLRVKRIETIPEQSEKQGLGNILGGFMLAEGIEVPDTELEQPQE